MLGGTFDTRPWSGSSRSRPQSGEFRSDIAERLCNNHDAIDFAKPFLATVDMAPPQVAKPIRDQALERIERLGGHFDEPRAAPVRVR